MRRPLSLSLLTERDAERLRSSLLTVRPRLSLLRLRTSLVGDRGRRRSFADKASRYDALSRYFVLVRCCRFRCLCPLSSSRSLTLNVPLRCPDLGELLRYAVSSSLRCDLSSGGGRRESILRGSVLNWESCESDRRRRWDRVCGGYGRLSARLACGGCAGLGDLARE